MVDLSGWHVQVIVSVADTTLYTLPQGTILPAGDYLVLYRSMSELALPDGGATVRLIRPNGRPIDAVRYGVLASDASYSIDEEGVWHDDWEPTPGAANSPLSVQKQRMLP